MTALERLNRLRVDMYCGQATEQQVNEASAEYHRLAKALGEGPPEPQFVDIDIDAEKRRKERSRK